MRPRATLRLHRRPPMRQERIALLLLALLPACGSGGGDGDGNNGPTTVSDFVRGLDGAVAITLDTDNIYWADRFGFIFAASKTMAARYMVVDTRGAIINRLAVDKTNIYWS